jgi:hypothetical protein
MKENGRDSKSVLMLQSSICLIKKEPDSGTSYNVTEEDSIKVEEADIKVELSNIKFEESVDIKEEIPQAITIPPIKCEPEVSEGAFCVKQQCFMFPRPFVATKRRLVE